MASPVDEQSDGSQQFTVPLETLDQELDQSLLSIPAQETDFSILKQDSDFSMMKQDSDSPNLFDDPQTTTSEFHHHAVEMDIPSMDIPSDSSAFHVISQMDPDKDSDLNPQLNSESQSFKQFEISSFSDEDKIATSGQSEEDSGKHFPAFVLEQADQCEDTDKNPECEDVEVPASGATDEDILLGITENITEADRMGSDSAEVTEKLLYVPSSNDIMDISDLGVTSEDVKTAQISDAESQFMKPVATENNSKDSSTACACLDNDIENDVKKQEYASPVHKPEEVFDIDEETRMGLDQTPIDPTMSEASFIYPTLPPKKLFQLDDTKDSEVSDTDTKMSAICDTEDIRLRNTISVDDATKDSVASDSNTETATPSRKQRRASREGLGISQMEGLESGERIFSAESLFEYQWPQDGGEWHMLQEQISEFLKIKSFKRKYPDLYRRTCDKEEKDFLRDKGVVTETQSDLGLTALRSEEVYDLMMKDYNDKYKEYISHLQEKQKKVIREKHKEYSAQAKLDKSKIDAYSKKAARSAAEFNASLMKDRKEERRAYFDLQTYTIHYPKTKFRTLAPEYTKTGAYPVALISGQYQDNFKRYSSEELKYYPVKTSLKDPPKIVKNIRPPPQGAKLPTIDKQRAMADSEGEESDSSSGEDYDDNDNNNTENENKENESMQMDKSDLLTPIKLEKKGKTTPKKKLTKLDKQKKGSKKNKEGEADKGDDRLNQEGDDKGGNADEKKMPGKIHGLEKCRICKQRSTKEERLNDKLVKCAECGKIGHMGCLDLTEELVAVIKTYPWQCMECKTCVECLDPYDEDKMMFCDRCDRGYHTFCIGLDALPTGHWECKSCEGAVKILEKLKPKKVVEVFSLDPSLSRKLELEMVEDKSIIKHEGELSGAAYVLGEEQQVICNGEEKEDVGSEKDGTASSEKGTASSEKDGTASSEAGTPANPERRGRKRKYATATPKSNTKTPAKAKSAKQARAQVARQSKRLKIKEEGEEEKKRKDEDKDSERKKKKVKKTEEVPGEESVEKDEVVDEFNDISESTESGVVRKEIHSDEFREDVSEGVDDSFVNMFDKNDDDEDKNMELINAVTEEEGAGTQSGVDEGIDEGSDAHMLPVTAEETPSQANSDSPTDKPSEVCLKADGFEEFDMKCSDNENKNLLSSFTTSSYGNEASDSVVANTLENSEMEAMPSPSNAATSVDYYQASSTTENDEEWINQLPVQQEQPQVLESFDASLLSSEDSSQLHLLHEHSDVPVQETPLLLPPESELLDELSQTAAAVDREAIPDIPEQQSQFLQAPVASRYQDLAAIDEDKKSEQCGLGLELLQDGMGAADITELGLSHDVANVHGSVADLDVVQELLTDEEKMNSLFTDESMPQP